MAFCFLLVVSHNIDTVCVSIHCTWIAIADFFYLNKIFIYLIKKIWYIDIYIDVYIYKLFETCSIQIDLCTCLNRGYMIFYLKLYNLQQQQNSF